MDWTINQAQAAGTWESTRYYRRLLSPGMQDEDFAMGQSIIQNVLQLDTAQLEEATAANNQIELCQAKQSHGRAGGVRGPGGIPLLGEKPYD